MKKPENPQAFAYGFGTDNYDIQQYGMSLRDYFAAKAMQAYIAGYDKGPPREYIAERAYELADAMLKIRENER